MTSVIYAPADSRGWGIGSAAMRDYFIGGALQPSEIYTVRVREHWRRARKPKTAVAAVTPAVVVASTSRRGRPKKRPPAPIRVLRSATRRNPVAVPVPVPAVPVPAAANTTLAVPLPPLKRRRLN